MKKIIFVEKQQHTYDPVQAFFKKKAPSVPKSLNPMPKPSSKQVADKKISTITQNIQKVAANATSKDASVKIGMAVQMKVSQKPKPYPTKQQILKTRDLSRTSIKKATKTSIKDENIFNLSKQITSHPKIDSQEVQDSIQKFKHQKIQNKPQKQQINSNDKDRQATNIQKIKQLQNREQQYIRKLQQFEAKQQKFVKNQQKMVKIQKQLKAALQKSREAESALSSLKDKETQIKQMLKGNEIPFNKKREVILNNKIKQLKRLNRQLILRIKNYKGTDLVQMATQQNRQQITKQLYSVSVQQQLKAEMYAEMESSIAQLIDKLHKYLSEKMKNKGANLNLNSEQIFLIDLINLSQKICLNYLNNYDLCPLLSTNQQAVSAYSILEQYKNCNKMAKIIDRFHLNFTLSQENMEIIQRLHQGQGQKIKIKSQINKQSLKKNLDKNKIFQYFKILEQKSNYNQILLIQKICQLQLIREWMNKTHLKINEELKSITKTFKEIKDIVQLGPNGKQSLFFYLSTNISLLQTKFPDLSKKIKEISSDFINLQTN